MGDAVHQTLLVHAAHFQDKRQVVFFLGGTVLLGGRGEYFQLKFFFQFRQVFLQVLDRLAFPGKEQDDGCTGGI